MEEPVRPADRRNAARRHLRQMEAIEDLLEFDRLSHELYADSIAETRQYLTRLETNQGRDG